jgi:His/Glu/Gln/Arg/opine family amino acid ABC transporter permease subunit
VLNWLEIHGSTYLAGFGWTAGIALGCSILAIVWGSLLLLVRMGGGRWGDRIVDGYVQLFRNTPVLLWIYFIYFGFPLVGLTWPGVVCGGLALVLQNGAYVSEILRGGLKAVDRVQFDAARSIGLSPWRTFSKVILPQVLVFSIPSLGNQVVLLLKDTSLLSAISVVELTMQAKLLTEQTGAAYQAFAVVAILYLVLVSGVEMATRIMHRRVRWR